jgi:non-heme chloroperoxidase
MTTHDSRLITLPGDLTLEVSVRGPSGGLPVLMLHGITDSWRSFEPLLPHLPREWQLVLVSQRGHGASHKPAHGYRTRDFATDAAALIQALELPPTLVVGHSMGTANALRMAMDRPELVRGLLLAGTVASYGDKPELAAWVADAIEPLRDPVPRALADEFQRGTLAQPVAEPFIARMVEQSLMAPAHVWRQSFAGLLEDDFSGELAGVRAPVHLVHGERDAYVPRTDFDRLRSTLPNATGELWPEAGHAMHWEQPGRFVKALVAFAESLPRRQPAWAA